MKVLHAHWHFPTTPTESGGMFFWAEDAAMTAPKGGRPTKKVKAHPFCTAPQAVAQWLGEMSSSFLVAEEIKRKNSHITTLLLPTTKFGPQPSPQLIHDWNIEDSKPPELSLWSVAGPFLSPLEAFTMLTDLPVSENLPPHLVLGVDCHYWQTVAKLVLETLAQQKMLPLLAPIDANGKNFHGRWLPILDGPYDGSRIARLLESMPPSCRAEADKPENAPSPRRLLDTFLNTMTDTLARQWGQSEKHMLARANQDTAGEWLQTLVKADPLVKGSVAQLAHLRQSYKVWLRNLHVAGDKTFRVAFRLEAPIQQAESAPQDWHLHFMLQARDDPSLLVPAEQVWQTKGNVLNALNRRFEQPQEKMLLGLGYAARLFPPIRNGLKTATPNGLNLSATESFNFMRESALLLESSGFGVLVPPWWNKPGTRLGVRLKMSGRKMKNDAIAKSRMSLDNLVRYQWELSIGQTTLTKEEFEALVALKSPLVQIRGQWVQLDPQQIEAAINFWKKYSQEGETSLAGALHLSLGAESPSEQLDVEEVELTGWLKDWMNQFTGNEKLTQLPPPETLQGQLRPYQQYGYSWLEFLRRWGMGACLADDMGLGKTIETIALLLRDKEQNSYDGPVLLICPTSVVANWEREVRRFAPSLTTMIHQGSERLRNDAFVEQAKQVDMVLTSYPLVRRDAETFGQIEWFGVILDEAQNIKNPEAKQTRAIRELPSGFRLALTGTPVENRLSELWSIMHFLNPSYLGSRQSFRQNFSLPIERYSDEEAVQRLKQLVNPFILRRVKTDPTVIQDLPDKIEMKVYCKLSEEQATLYESVVKHTMEQIESASGIERKGLVLSMLMKLKQICNHPIQFLHEYGGDGRQIDAVKETERSGKLTRLMEMLEEIVAVDDRVLIFSQFSEMGKFLHDHLQQALGVSTLFLHGGTPTQKREVMIKRFQEPKGPPIFILSLKAGGTGLNLTNANHVVHFDRWWNPAVEDQATDRAFRIGQTRNVQVHKFVCVGTLEEMIDDMIESKKALAQSIVGSGENWLTELSTNELRDLVKLRRQAVE